MQDLLTDALGILIACLVVAGVASALVVFRPAARRRRRRRQHHSRPKIDLFVPAHAEAAPDKDA